MKAIGFNAPFNLEDGNQFQEIEFNIPNPTRNQLLIKVQSISVNPVDTKQRILPVNHAPRILDLMRQVLSNKLEKMSQCLSQETMCFIQVLQISMALMKNIS